MKRKADNTVNNLVHDLADIAKMYGPMSFDKDAFDYVEQDIHDGIPPEPKDNHLSEYVQRRVSHFIKIAMAVSASRRGTRKIMRSTFRLVDFPGHLSMNLVVQLFRLPNKSFL